VTVFTIRADTLLGVTHVTLAAEHPLVSSISTADQNKQVDNCAAQTSSRSNLDRTTAKEKTGVFAGGYGIHPISGDHIPVWVGDYVLGSYGTGAVMAVPAHDTRDFEFAQKFDVDIKWVVIVIKPQKGELNAEQAFAEYGVAMNSGQGLDDLSTSECKIVMTKKLEDISKGEPHDHIRMQI
jgi:leucyl-tRNA synthetase